MFWTNSARLQLREMNLRWNKFARLSSAVNSTWVVTSFSSVETHRHFGGTDWLHLQIEELTKQATNSYVSPPAGFYRRLSNYVFSVEAIQRPCCLLVPCLSYTSTLKMVEIFCSETSGSLLTKWLRAYHMREYLLINGVSKQYRNFAHDWSSERCVAASREF